MLVARGGEDVIVGLGGALICAWTCEGWGSAGCEAAGADCGSVAGGGAWETDVTGWGCAPLAGASVCGALADCVSAGADCVDCGAAGMDCEAAGVDCGAAGAGCVSAGAGCVSAGAGCVDCGAAGACSAAAGACAGAAAGACSGAAGAGCVAWGAADAGWGAGGDAWVDGALGVLVTFVVGPEPSDEAESEVEVELLGVDWLLEEELALELLWTMAGRRIDAA